MIIKLSKPVMIDGNEKTLLQYDLDNLTGNNFEMAFKKLAKSGHMVVMKETDHLFHVALFSEASGIDLNDLRRLSIRDYEKVGTLVRDFLLQDLEEYPQGSILEESELG